MKRLLLNIYIWPMFIIVTLIFFTLLPFFLLFYKGLLRQSVDFKLRRAISLYGWILVRLVPFFAPIKVEFKTEKLPFPAILVANHNSALDPYLFGALLIDVSFITTWPFKIPGYGYCMRLARYINANDGWENVYQKSAELLHSGTSIIVWPEGHRSRDGRLGRFKNGAFALAVETGFPLLPVSIIGTDKFLPPGERFLSPSRIKLILHDPIFPDLHNDQKQEIIKLRNTVKEVIKKTLEENKKQFGITYAKGFQKGEQC